MERESSAPLRVVRRVQFGLLGPDDIREMSVCEVHDPMHVKDGKVVAGGVLDLRMGTVSRDQKCATCNGNQHECPGHFGHIELSKPVFNVGFMDKIVHVLNSVCLHCAKLRVPVTDKAMQEILASTEDNMQNRLKSTYALCRSVAQCKPPDTSTTNIVDINPEMLAQAGCGFYQPIVKRMTTPGDRLKLQRVPRGNQGGAGDGVLAGPEPLTPEMAREIMARISDADCRALGFDPVYARPDWMVFTVLPVPPLHVRPSVEMDGGSSQDDLTYQLCEVLKASRQLREIVAAGALNADEQLDLLQFKVATMSNNAMPGMNKATQRSGRPLKSISDRLKGKEGRVRGNLMGKRVDFSARTVITPDPNLAIDQVGVPQSIAYNLTFPERVTAYNRDRMQQLVENGPHTYPGAKYIIKADGRRIDLSYVQAAGRYIEEGDIVERQMVDDDVVVFNRQPTLHKMSMMGHRAKVLPWCTFRLNLSVTTPYNADFDGDEMNLHMPQSLLARAEIEEMMLVHKNIITPQANRPVMGIVQDTLNGTRLLTRRDTFLSHATLMQLLMWYPQWDGKIPAPAILRPLPLWTGKQVFSLLLPPKINLVRHHSAHDDKEDSTPNLHITVHDTRVVIDAGQLVSGIVCKKTIGNVSGGLLHVLVLECGHEVARQFYGNLQTVVNNWILVNGFSIGVTDAVPDEASTRKVVELQEKARHDVEDIINTAYADELELLPGNTLRMTFESKVNNVLNGMLKEAGDEVTKSLSEHNNFKAMVQSGSKGSSLNISQIMACVGQQNVEGKRVPFGFSYRSLPHFVKDDYGPASKGFVFNSFLRGLTPTEFYFHAMGGREGVIDTAVKTAETGYIQRRLIKSMEGLRLQYDGSIRTPAGELVQLLYGEDGIDAAWVESQKLPTLKMATNKFTQEFRFDEHSTEAGRKRLRRLVQEGIVDDLATSPDAEQLFAAEFQALLADRQALREVQPDGEDGVYLPCDMKRLIANARKQFRISDRVPSDLSPLTVISETRALLEKLVVVDGGDSLSLEAQHNATLLFASLVRATLASKRVLAEHHLTHEAFKWVLGEIEARFRQAMAHPGEMVGALAAQSLGEPATQMTLNTFHMAGVSAKNVTLGVPRLKEIINVSKSPKTPSLVVHLTDDVNNDRIKANQVRARIQYTTLHDLVTSSAIYYDPDPKTTVVAEDRQLVETTMSLEETDMLSPWMLRLTLNRAAHLELNLQMSDIGRKLMESFNGTIQVILSDDNAEDNVVLRVRMVRNTDAKTEGEYEQRSEEELLRQLETEILSKTQLQGIAGISKVYLTHATKKGGQGDKMKVYIDTNGEFQRAERWLLETDGSSLLKVLQEDHVDARNTTSNDICEVFTVLGIEAARKAVESEMAKVISFGGSYVNYRHLALLCEVMTARGYLMAVTRHGINRQNTGVLMRCSFEETVDILLEAAAHSEADLLRGVSENIMLGNLAPAGTGSFELYLDATQLSKAMVVSASDNIDSFMPMDGLGLGMGGATPFAAQTPHLGPGSYYQNSPMHAAGAGAFTPDLSGGASPGAWSEYRADSPLGAGAYSPSGAHGYSPTSPGYSPTSPGYSPTSPGYSPASPGYSPQGPGGASPASPGYSPTSPGYSPASPSYSPTSPGYSPTSPKYSPTSPNYSPSSPSYSPSSPSYSPSSPSYSPSSPSYSPSSPSYSPSSPSYSPSSPSYSPSSPSYSPQGGASPSSPSYSPSSPSYSPQQ